MSEGQRLLVLTDAEYNFLVTLVSRFITLANSADHVALSLQVKVQQAASIQDVDVLLRPLAENQMDNAAVVPIIGA